MKQQGSTLMETQPSLWHEARIYVANVRRFEKEDWLPYLAWMATNGSLFLGVMSFLVYGAIQGIVYPGYVWFVPLGSGMFVFALAFDDIGHRTLYKQDLRKGEGFVHQMIIATAVSSVVALCLAYDHRETFTTPALGLIALSFFYSAIDELMHWQRYFSKGIDRVEMWSHFVAITGHVLMIVCWWQWLQDGYPGVAETFALLLPRGRNDDDAVVRSSAQSLRNLGSYFADMAETEEDAVLAGS